MAPPSPAVILEDYGISPEYGFLPMELPLEVLPDPYYSRWEAVAVNLQALLLSRRLRGVIRGLPVLSTEKLRHPAEWRRAYVLLAFMTHAYVWGGDSPEERVPPPISIPFLKVCEHLELPPVATYSGVCLWNWKPIFADEPENTLENLSTLMTFTGSLDESWFYLISVAIEARGAPLIPLMLNAMEAVRRENSRTDYSSPVDREIIIESLRAFAIGIEELGSLLVRMYESCDPHVFYHRIRPFLAGSKNMKEAGLPNGVIYEDGSGQEPYVQYGGGSNAQSSLIQFFDIVLGVEHRPTGIKASGHKSASSDSEQESSVSAARLNFIHDMRSYMPGPHRRFLEHVIRIANIREYVEKYRKAPALVNAYDACLAMLRSLRDKHIAMISRYIIVKSRESRSHSRSLSPRDAPKMQNLATASKAVSQQDRPGNKELRGTGGTALISFLKQARDETGEPAIDAWARRLLSNGPGAQRADFASLDKIGENKNGQTEIVGLAGTWAVDEDAGGICHW